MASVATATSKGKVEVRIDRKEGSLLGTLEVQATGGDNNWKTQSCKLSNPKGVHDLYFVFKGEGDNLFNFDWWSLK
jgi:hypothetical protein